MALHIPIKPLKTRSGLEPVSRCEPSTYHPICQKIYPLEHRAGEVARLVICLLKSKSHFSLYANGKSRPCNGSIGFPLSLSEWFFTIFLTPYSRK